MLSGITFLGIPTEVYLHGSQYVISVFGNVAACVTFAYVIIPLFYELQFSSIYEYLELRYSKFTRIFASALYTISLLMYIPIVIYVPALAFSQVTGHNVHTITPVFSFVCIFYTTIVSFSSNYVTSKIFNLHKTISFAFYKTVRSNVVFKVFFEGF